MTAPTKFRITQGRFGLAIVDTAEVGYLPSWLAPGGKTIQTAAIADYEAGSETWSCQITEMRMTSTASTRTETQEDTICEAGSEIPNPQKSAWAVVLSLYQDANYVALQQYADEHDAEEAYFFCAFNGTIPPKAIGTLMLHPVDALGGVARTDLKTTVTWQCKLSQRLYGDATTSAPAPATVTTLGVDDDEYTGELEPNDDIEPDLQPAGT